MSALRALITLATAAAASLALSVAIGLAQEDEVEHEPEAELGVEWAFRPDNLGQLVRHSQAAVIARVTDVAAGEPQGPEDGAQIPTQHVEVEVERTLIGKAPQTMTVFALGGSGIHPQGSPAYEEGESYLLFVRRRLDDQLSAPHPDGTWIESAPDGRLHELATGRLRPLIEGPVAERLAGKTPSEAQEAAQETGAAPASDPSEAKQ